MKECTEMPDVLKEFVREEVPDYGVIYRIRGESLSELSEKELKEPAQEIEVPRYREPAATGSELLWVADASRDTYRASPIRFRQYLVCGDGIHLV